MVLEFQKVVKFLGTTYPLGEMVSLADYLRGCSEIPKVRLPNGPIRRINCLFQGFKNLWWTYIVVGSAEQVSYIG